MLDSRVRTGTLPLEEKRNGDMGLTGWLSAPAVAALVSRLERQPMTATQVRYLPISPAHDARGALRYGRDDVALVRLAARLTRLFRREGWPLWKVRAALLYLGPLLRLSFAEVDAYAVVVNSGDATAAVVRVEQASALPGRVAIPLTSLIVADSDWPTDRLTRRNAEAETDASWEATECVFDGEAEAHQAKAVFSV